ncbi:hypothetical protein DMR_40170 [Solidesulfovibrio magneticus RS-1]|uniref:Uncharacterized protein n=1 Tax=Solidesulfovibrio magneticus (strain ATCC 700980 / DSM 13731 / RS-1) TaxID=573370 RepID=C4XP06_SOLM1|nr:hypothetical protein DMR_40170 [Solidesulfovibrio magneticus RS-1]
MVKSLCVEGRVGVWRKKSASVQVSACETDSTTYAAKASGTTHLPRPCRASASGQPWPGLGPFHCAARGPALLEMPFSDRREDCRHFLKSLFGRCVSCQRRQASRLVRHGAAVGRRERTAAWTQHGGCAGRRQYCAADRRVSWLGECQDSVYGNLLCAKRRTIAVNKRRGDGEFGVSPRIRRGLVLDTYWRLWAERQEESRQTLVSA